MELLFPERVWETKHRAEIKSNQFGSLSTLIRDRRMVL